MPLPTPGEAQTLLDRISRGQAGQEEAQVVAEIIAKARSLAEGGGYGLFIQLTQQLGDVLSGVGQAADLSRDEVQALGAEIRRLAEKSDGTAERLVPLLDRIAAAEERAAAAAEAEARRAQKREDVQIERENKVLDKLVIPGAVAGGGLVGGLLTALVNWVVSA